MKKTLRRVFVALAFPCWIVSAGSDQAPHRIYLCSSKGSCSTRRYPKIGQHQQRRTGEDTVKERTKGGRRRLGN
ncbi:hypothetical protein KP509_22G043100 [Ceratopteris richardii]|uniref:Secreted protein n=1 Tax=Ceratopteris richardii TaxID=49495 RepID=A0A8T2S762_CERRI|nr:hypothetical protein KP509_22G043100 [Ceratopteris richardii]